jgi:spore coat protein SA
MIYHLLTESEPFSEHFGGALSRWTANVLREDEDSMIVCPWADTSWNFPPRRIIAVPGFTSYRRWALFLRRHPFGHFRTALLNQVLKTLTKRLKKQDTVYIHNRPEFALALHSPCHQLGVKLVLHMQNSHLTYFPKQSMQKLKADAFVFCSSFLKSEALEFGVPLANANVIPNGADEELFFPVPDRGLVANKTSSPVVLFVGRLVPEKGAHLFLAAMKMLKAKGYEVLGRLIGSSSFGMHPKTAYEQHLMREKPSNVEFGEYLSGKDLAEAFRNASVFCCPSIWNEPFGMVNVEAMATALPVVATDVGGIPEIFEQGGGLLVSANRPNELADAIESLLTDSRRRAQLSQEGFRSFQKRYRWQGIRNQYRGLIDSLGTAA